jgi:hypothetical protein
MKAIFFLFTFVGLISGAFSGAENDRLRTLIQVEHVGGVPKVFVVEKKAFIPSIPESEVVKKKLLELKEGSEAIVEGRIHFEAIHLETQGLRPYFIIEKVMPVSLGDLGSEARSFKFELTKPIEMPSTVYQPSSLPVTTEVASAITLTTGLLLFEELSASGRELPEAREQQRALLLSTGAFATLFFIYDQIQGKSKP